MPWASLPSLHCRSRRVFIAGTARDVFSASSERKFLADFFKPILKAFMAYGASFTRHCQTVLSCLRADDRLESQRLHTLGPAKVVHLLMDALDQLREALCLLVFRRRSYLARDASSDNLALRYSPLV
jgi:hypothetical protein